MFRSVALVVAVIVAGVAGAQEAKSKARFAVLEFEVVPQYDYGYWHSHRVMLADQVSDMMTNELVKKGVRLVERKRIKDVLAEQDFSNSKLTDPNTAAQLGKILGVDYIVVGSIVEWGMSQSNAGAAGVLGNVTGVRVRETRARARITMRVVNTTTAEIEEVAEGEATEKSTSVGFTVDWYKTVNLDNSEWWSSMVGKATKKAVDQLVGKVEKPAKELPSLGVKEPPLRAVVRAVMDGGEAVIDAGAKKGLKAGDKLIVSRVSNVVKDDQGNVIFEDRKQVGTAVVIEVQDGGARIRLEGGGTLQAGDVVEKAA